MTQPLSERARRRALIVAAVVVAFTALALIATRGGAPKPARRAASPPPVVVVAAPPPPAAAKPAPSSSTPRERAAFSRARAAATTVARRFMAAFVAYDAGRLDPHVRAPLRATTTAALYRSLVARPPLHVPGVRPRGAVVVSLTAGDDAPQGGLPIAVMLRRRGREEALVIVLTRKDAQWEVSQIGA